MSRARAEFATIAQATLESETQIPRTRDRGAVLAAAAALVGTAVLLVSLLPSA